MFGECAVEWDWVLCQEVSSSSLLPPVLGRALLSILLESEEKLMLWSLSLDPALELPGNGPVKSLETENREEPPGLEGGFGKT